MLPVKLDPVRFQTAFVRQVRQPATAPLDGLAPARPQDSGLMTRVLGFFSPKPKLPPQEPVALASVLPALGGTAAVALAHQVALAQLSIADEEAVGRDYAAKQKTGPGQERLTALWDRLAPHFPSLEAPLALDAPVGPGMFVGRSLFANGEEKLPEPVALFFLAHEAGHVENRDSARKQGQAALKAAGAELGDAIQDADRAMEFAADRRAAEVVARLGCDPAPILEELLTLAAGPEHPDGLERARAVRQVMGEHGAPLAEDRWLELVARTAPLRAENQRKQDEAHEWLSLQREII